MQPGAGVVPAEVSVDEEAGAGRLGVAAVLREVEQRQTVSQLEIIISSYGDGVLHIRHGRVELDELQLRAVHDGEGEVPAGPAGQGGHLLHLVRVGQMGGVVAAGGDALRDLVG